MEAERRPSFSNIISCLNETLSYDADTSTGPAGLSAILRRNVRKIADGMVPPAPPAPL